jgi:hypothetical protein
MPTQCRRDLFGYEVVEGRFRWRRGHVGCRRAAARRRDRAIGLVTRFAACFDDGRVQTQVEHRWWRSPCSASRSAMRI